MPWGQLREGWYITLARGVIERHGFPLDTPYENLPSECQHELLYGTDEQIAFDYKSRSGSHEGVFRHRYEGIIHNLERRYHQTDSPGVREWIEKFMNVVPCPECGGVDGMVAVDRAGVRGCPGLSYYRPPAPQHDLYTPCPECNRRGRIPAHYYSVDEKWLLAWLSARCECADCRRERMDNAAPADGDGKRGAERMFR